jgi:hypothetical protein
MAKPRALAQTQQYGFLTLSFGGFALWWLVILGVHLIAFAFNACYAKFYWDFGDTFLSFSLEAYNAGAPNMAFLFSESKEAQ